MMHTKRTEFAASCSRSLDVSLSDLDRLAAKKAVVRLAGDRMFIGEMTPAHKCLSSLN